MPEKINHIIKTKTMNTDIFLKETFFKYMSDYSAPVCAISDFINREGKVKNFESSYPLGLTYTPLWELLPKSIVKSMQAALLDFKRKNRTLSST